MQNTIFNGWQIMLFIYFLLATMMHLLENDSSDKTSIGCSYKWKNQWYLEFVVASDEALINTK